MSAILLHAHVVRARLSTGWFEQACTDAHEAAALFDRLLRYEGVPIERVENGRVVEYRRLCPPVGPGAMRGGFKTLSPGET